MEQIDAGRKFLDEFERCVPVRAAFWLKASEDSGRYLHIASDHITDQNIAVAYGEVLRLGAMIQDPRFDPFQVKLIGVDNPLARAVLDIYQRFPARIPTRVGSMNFGGSSIEGLYIYPPAVSTSSKSSVIQRRPSRACGFSAQ